MKTPRDMHRRWNLTAGGPRQGAAPTQVGARSTHMYCGGIAFVAGGSGRFAALVFLEPLAIEAGPLPGFSRGNGGRCYPHSYPSILQAVPASLGTTGPAQPP